MRCIALTSTLGLARGMAMRDTGGPPLATRSTRSVVFKTGIKSIDVLLPLETGGKTGLFGGAGVGKTLLLLIDNILRFIQAGPEVSGLMGQMPSRLGYQPTMAPDWRGWKRA